MKKSRNLKKKSRTAKTSVRLFLEGSSTLPFTGLTGRRLKNAALRICEMADLTGVAISIILTDDDGIRKINRKYRKKARPTDVISFAYRENPFPVAGGVLEELGDVYISLERAQKQAAYFGVTPAEELMRLLVHGILHLAGYDHERSTDDAALMNAKQAEILSAITRRLPFQPGRF